MTDPMNSSSEPPVSLNEAFSLGYGLIGPILNAPRQAPVPSLSIAVLPFSMLTAGDSVVADAMTDDLITHLSRIPAIRVIARSSMFTYKDSRPDPRAVGRDLDVGHIVSGTVRLGAGRMVVNVELVTAKDGMQQWGERFELSEGDWLTASDVAARRIARSLNLELLDVASRASFPASHYEMQAMKLAIRGWVDLFKKPQTAESNRSASRWLNEAIEIDPELALAWTGLSYAAYRAGSFGWENYSLQEGYRHAVELAQRALELDPRQADAYYSMGQSLNGLDELERAHSAHEACIALNPSHAPAYAGLGQVRMFLGRPEETWALCDKAFQFSPREPLRAVWHRTKGLAALFLDDPESAALEAEAAIALNAKYPSAYVVLAASAFRLGQQSRAQTAIATLRTMRRFQSVEEVREFHQRPRQRRYAAMLEKLLADLRSAGLP